MRKFNVADLRLAVKTRFSVWRLWMKSSWAFNELFSGALMTAISAGALVTLSWMFASLAGVKIFETWTFLLQLLAFTWGILYILHIRGSARRYWHKLVADAIKNEVTLDELVELHFEWRTLEAVHAQARERFFEIASTEHASTEKVLAGATSLAVAGVVADEAGSAVIRDAGAFRTLFNAGRLTNMLNC